jgi:hypothetical protein
MSCSHHRRHAHRTPSRVRRTDNAAPQPARRRARVAPGAVLAAALLSAGAVGGALVLGGRSEEPATPETSPTCSASPGRRRASAIPPASSSPSALRLDDGRHVNRGPRARDVEQQRRRRRTGVPARMPWSKTLTVNLIPMIRTRATSTSQSAHTRPAARQPPEEVPRNVVVDRRSNHRARCSPACRTWERINAPARPGSADWSASTMASCSSKLTSQ